jgi:hypothetical protein
MAAPTNKLISPQAVFSRTVVATTAEVTFHNPTNVVVLFDEGVAGANNPNGLRITSVYARARAAIATANNCQLYLKSGTTYTLIDSALLAVHTPGASVANGTINFNYADDNPLFIEPGYGLAVAIGLSVANGVVFYCSGGKYSA